MIRGEEPRRLGRSGVGILDRLGLVEDRVVEPNRRERGGVATQRSVRRDDDVDRLGIDRAEAARAAREVEHSESWRETLRLADPVEDERSWHDDDRRTPRRVRRFAHRIEQREDLHRLPEAHVVGETSTKAESVEKVQPAEALALIGAQRAAEVRPGVDGTHLLEGTELGARLLECRVDARFGHGPQQRIEQRDLRRSVADDSADRPPAGGERPQSGQPFQWEKTKGAIGEEDARRTCSSRLEQLGERDLNLPELHAGVELEPVDARPHDCPCRSGTAILRAACVDLPAGTHDIGDERAQFVGGDHQAVFAQLGILPPLLLDTVRCESRARGGFGSEVAIVHGTCVGVVHRRRSLGASDFQRPVTKARGQATNSSGRRYGR